MIQTEPVEYKINWVRVYQDKNDPKQKVGCSTKERPTRKFIEAHEKRYKQDGDVSNYQDIVLLISHLRTSLPQIYPFSHTFIRFVLY